MKNSTVALRPVKRAFVNLLFFVLTGVITLCLVELVLTKFENSELTQRRTRWASIPEESWTEYHPVLGWFHKLNASVYLKKNNAVIPVTTNSAGMRSQKEYTAKKGEGIFRILAFGDSFLFGFGVEDDETVSFEIEKRDQQIEMMNFGVAGYGVDQMLILFEEIAGRYEADHYLFFIYPEDFWRALRAYDDAGHAKPYFELSRDGRLNRKNIPVPEEIHFDDEQFPDIVPMPGFLRMFYRTRLFYLAERAVNRIRKMIGTEDPETSLAWILGREILGDAVAAARERKTPVSFFIVPPQRWVEGTVEPIRDSMIRFGKRENVPVIDLTPYFKKAAAQSAVEEYYIKDDQHWTAAGHRLAADAVMQHLSDYSNNTISKN